MQPAARTGSTFTDRSCAVTAANRRDAGGGQLARAAWARMRAPKGFGGLSWCLASGRHLLSRRDRRRRRASKTLNPARGGAERGGRKVAKRDKSPPALRAILHTMR